MVYNWPWYDRLVDYTGDLFCFGIITGSAFYMLYGMCNSPKGERLIWGAQAVRLNAPRCGGRCAIWGGFSAVFESSMIYVRKKDDPWTSILSGAAAEGFLKMCQGLGPASRSALIVGSGITLLQGHLIMKNKVASNV